MATNENPLTRCAAAISQLRSGKIPARRVHSSQRPFLGHSKTSLAQRNGTTFGLNELEALHTAAHEAKG
ncbi:MAG: hypothetical protein K0S45_4335 [Nitrospira sp.]|jgi:hypothetical protein|nr:hypothetical protein [Nitrospira sp.]